MLLRVALLFTVTDACPRVRETHYLLPTTSNGFGNQYYAIEKAMRHGAADVMHYVK